MPDVGHVGEIATIANDPNGLLSSISENKASGADFVSGGNALLSIGATLINRPFLSAFSLTANGVALAAEYRKLQDGISNGDRQGAIEAALGIVSAIGGIIALAPTPQTKLIGIAISATAPAAKELYKNSDAHEAMVN